jgi:hypothetical protein
MADMDRSRLDSFAGDLARALRGASPELRHEAAKVAANWAINRTGIAHEALSSHSLDRVAALVVEWEDRYFAAYEAREAGRDTIDVVAAFSQTRAASAVEFMLRGESDEAIYEAASAVDDWSELRVLLLSILNGRNPG